MKSASQHLGASGMMSNISNKDDDEDELEALRLAALESLRVKGLPPPVPVATAVPPPNLSVPPPQPVLPTNHAFKRHQGNQNLIAIIPVDQSASSVVPLVYQKPPPNAVNPPSLLDLRLPPPPSDSITRQGKPPLLKDRPTVRPVFDQPPPQAAEEKPKVPTKFSRFEDSDSDDDEDDVDLSVAKSDNEEEEIVIEAADADDIVIEIVDEEAADEEEVVDEIVLEEPDDELTDELCDSIQAPVEKVGAKESSHVVKNGCEVKESLPERTGTRKRSASPVRKPDSPKDQRSSRECRNESSYRPTEERSSRSPKVGTRSPNARRRSPVRSQRSPVRSKRSPVRRSPTRSQRSPPRVARSPARSHRSPLRSQRSPARTHRSPTRCQRSPPRSPLRSRSPQQRSQRSPARTQANKSPPPKYNDRDKSRPDSAKPASVLERLGSAGDQRRTSEPSKSSSGDRSGQRGADQKRASDKSRSPTSDRKILVRKSPVPSRRSASNEKEAQKCDDPDRERLEQRKRKFEMPVDLEAKKDSKIRLRSGASSPRPADEKPKKTLPVPVKVRREEPSPVREKSLDTNAEERNSKSAKRSSKKSKEERRQNRSRPESGEAEPPTTVKLAGVKSKDADSSDLRAELQRRRNNRCEDDEPRSRTPETRRILVLNSPTTGPTSVIQTGSSKQPVEPANGVLSKQKRSTDSHITSDSSDSTLPVDAKRSSKVNGKRAPLKSPIEMDKGRETDPLEDRIRHIRAQNELIRQRQMEIEADKLQYA